MGAEADALRARVEQFAIRLIRFVRTLPHDPAADAVRNQLARAGSGVSSTYHSASRSRTRAEFLTRLALVADETDDSVRWLTTVRDSGWAPGSELEWLLGESGQLRAIFRASLAKTRRNQRVK